MPRRALEVSAIDPVGRRLGDGQPAHWEAHDRWRDTPRAPGRSPKATTYVQRSNLSKVDFMCATKVHCFTSGANRVRMWASSSDDRSTSDSSESTSARTESGGVSLRFRVSSGSPVPHGSIAIGLSPFREQGCDIRPTERMIDCGSRSHVLERRESRTISSSAMQTVPRGGSSQQWECRR